MSHDDLDAEFERIVSGWDLDGVEPDLPSDAPTDAERPTSVDDVGLALPIAPTTAHVWRGPTSTDDAETAESRPGAHADDHDRDDHDRDDHEDHFQPQEPDLPTAEDDPMFWAIVTGLVGGPLLLLYVIFFDRGGSPWWVVLGIVMIVVGFVMLVLRGGTERDPFDDGSRV